MEEGNKKEIIKKRKEIEQELIELLKDVGSVFTLDHIKDIIYYEKESDDLMKVVAMFDCRGDISELSNILELTNDAWNYFPHKCLKGLSPMEMILKNQKLIKK